MPAVVVKTGPTAGRRVELDADVAVGRQDGDLVLEDPEVSRRHAVLRRSGASVVVEDLDSTNGTFVNGERIRSPRTVRPGDELRIGRTTLEIEPDPRSDDTIVSQANAWVDDTIVSPPLRPDQVRPATMQPVHDPRTDYDDATQPLPPRVPERGVRPTRSRRSWLVVGAVVLAMPLAVIAYARLVDGPTESDFASSAIDACAAVQRSEEGVDLSRTPTSGDLHRARNIRLQALGAMRTLEPPEQDADSVNRFLSAFAETNVSITRLERSIGSDTRMVAGARESLREDVRNERELASKAGMGECGGLGIG